MSPSVRRYRTARALDLAVARHGLFSRASFAAHGRAFVAWQGRIRPPDFTALPDPQRSQLAHAYTIAQLRAYGDHGFMNRRWRRWYREKRCA